ncbi:MAG TPA: glycosyltransferase [Solirubrobacterales bacterium]
MALVSVVMGAWRPRADWLRVAVRSALAQRDADVDVIVVDDGSPEPVEPLLAGFDDPRLRCIRSEHRGLAAARNQGIALARGEWVRFLDADDEFPAGSTAALLELAHRHPGAIVYGWTTFCDGDLRPVWTMRSRVSGDAGVACVTGRFSVRVPAMMFPRGLFERELFDPSFATTEDWDFLLRALDHAQVVGGDFEALRYRRSGGGLTADRGAAERDARRAIAGWFERHPEARGTRVERLARGYLHAQAARAAAAHGELRAAVPEALRAARLAPGALAQELRLGARALGGKLRGARRSD